MCDRQANVVSHLGSDPFITLASFSLFFCSLRVLAVSLGRPS